VHDFVSALLGHFAQVEQLRFKMLVASAHTCVDRGSFFHFSSFFLKSKYASMARRTNSATGAPVFSYSFWSFASCVRYCHRMAETQGSGSPAGASKARPAQCRRARIFNPDLYNVLFYEGGLHR
jgi:hypothetical protein